jgi:hypothetical protein
VYLKNIGDCVPSRDQAIGTPLDPPLFWLDNIKKKLLIFVKIFEEYLVTKPEKTVLSFLSKDLNYIS